jgi:hypothetical protein
VGGTDYFDPSGMESIPYDMDRYLKRMGPNVAIPSFDAFKTAVAAEDPFQPGGVLFFMKDLPEFNSGLADPLATPGLSNFIAAKEGYLEIFKEVMIREKLDGLVFLQMRAELPPLTGTETLRETPVSEINIAGLPGVTGRLLRVRPAFRFTLHRSDVERGQIVIFRVRLRERHQTSPAANPQRMKPMRNASANGSRPSQSFPAGPGATLLDANCVLDAVRR